MHTCAGQPVWDVVQVAGTMLPLGAACQTCGMKAMDTALQVYMQHPKQTRLDSKIVESVVNGRNMEMPQQINAQAYGTP